MSDQSRLYQHLLAPVITEKSTRLREEHDQYTFFVNRRVNKIELVKAFELAYPGRKVLSVRLIKVPSEMKRSGKRVGMTPERRKAIFRIQGEPIIFMAEGGV